MDNLSTVLYGKKDLRMENFPPRNPKPHEVQISVKACGVCSTDVHLYDTAVIGPIAVSKPSVLGHEFSGVVTAVGDAVTHLKAGDRVTVDSLASCRNCRQCQRGFSNTCLSVSYIGIPPMHGGLARRATVPAGSVYKLPDELEFEEGAMMEPLAVCVNACNRAGIKTGDNVLVFGAGPVGLMTTQVALARGATNVCVTDRVQERLDLAKELGATHTVLFSKEETDAQVNAQKLKDTVGEEIDVAVECSGAPLCLQTSIYIVRPRGVVAAIGLGPDNITVPITDAIIREIDVRGCVANNFCYPTAIKLLMSKRVKVKPIISHRVRLEEVPRALDLVRSCEALKVMVNCSCD